MKPANPPLLSLLSTCGFPLQPVREQPSPNAGDVSLSHRWARDLAGDLLGILLLLATMMVLLKPVFWVIALAYLLLFQTNFWRYCLVACRRFNLPAKLLIHTGVLLVGWSLLTI